MFRPPTWRSCRRKSGTTNRRVALAGGADGLDVIRELAGQAQRALAPGGWLVFEFGHGQEAGVRAALGASPLLELVRIAADLQRIPRVVVARRLS